MTDIFKNDNMNKLDQTIIQKRIINSMGLKNIILITVMSLSLTLYACEGEKVIISISNEKAIGNVNLELLENLARKKIFFGHQSVGNNIISGIEDLMIINPNINLRIVEADNPRDFSSGIFAHHSVGQNVDPESKIKDFVRMMHKGIGDKADIAFFKFCYIDFNSSTNVHAVFNDYKDAMENLKGKYQNTRFIHCTVPLVSKVKITPISLLKRLLGRDGNKNNVARNEFNDLMRKEYQGKEPVFDLAAVESTYSDGSRETFDKDGNTYYALIPSYTDDGGHLNELGRKLAAEKLLMLLISL